MSQTRKAGFPSALIAIATCVAAAAVAAAAAVDQARREFEVVAKRYTYEVSGVAGPEIRVKQDDLVRIAVRVAEGDIPHSFTVPDYRIDRRAEPGKPAMVMFRADKPGTFAIKCTLTIDERCAREMHGRLIVEPR
jgi:heme/copper-type cytochrome/quinol oxidase subunit 2